MTDSSNLPTMDSLFELGEPKPDWSDADLSAMLRHQLDAPIDLDQRFPSIRALLCASQPPVESLEVLKRLAKLRRTEPLSVVPSDLWRLIYFASIAAARHIGHSISDLSHDDLAAGFRWALSKPWIDPVIRELIERGVDTD